MEPFRDELTAALARMGELEAENEELRARLAEAEAAQKASVDEAKTAVTSSQGVAANMKRESEELRDKLAKTSAELREANDRAAAIERAGPVAESQGQVAIGVFAVLFGIALGMMIAYARHC